MVTADRYRRALIAKNHFSDPRGNDADTELTGVVAFDDGDIGVANALFDLLAHLVERLTAFLDQFVDRHTGDACARPQKHLRNPMFTDDLRLDLVGIDFKMLGQMNAETQAIEESAGTEPPIMPRAIAGNIGERI